MRNDGEEIAALTKAQGVRAGTEVPKWYKGFIFKDESLVFELIRVMAKTVEHGADIGESLAAAVRIKQKEGDRQQLLDAWYHEWKTLAERIEKTAEECLSKGHKVSAGEAYLRASEYYRSADFYLHDRPDDPAVLYLWNKMEYCFEEARKLTHPFLEAVRIPYEGTVLPG